MFVGGVGVVSAVFSHILLVLSVFVGVVGVVGVVGAVFSHSTELIVLGAHFGNFLKHKFAMQAIKCIIKSNLTMTWSSGILSING